MSSAALALGVVLSWSAPDRCPDERAFRTEVEELLGRSLDDTFARWVDVRAEVRRARGSFVLSIAGDGSGGPFQRELQDRSCEALADAAALIVALAIDPNALDPIDPPPAPVSPPEPPASPPAIEYAEPIESRPSSGLPFGLPWPRLAFSVLGAVEGGVGPRAGPGLLIAGALLWRYLRLEALGGYWFERTARAADDPDSAASISLVAGGGRACPTLPFVVEASLCFGIEAGQLRADPIESSDQEPGRIFWGAVTAGGSLAWEPIEMLAIRAGGEAFWSVFRPSYASASAKEIHRPARFGGRGTVGIEVRFF